MTMWKMKVYLFILKMEFSGRVVRWENIEVKIKINK